MADKPAAQALSSGRDQRKNIPVVTVESFYVAHAEKLQLKLEGKRVGFHRKIREPTINRPGLALAGFYNYFAEKRIQVLGSAEFSYLKSLDEDEAGERLRMLCARRVPCLVVSRGARIPRLLLDEAARAGVAVFR